MSTLFRLFVSNLAMICLLFYTVSVTAEQPQAESLQEFIAAGGAYVGSESCLACHDDFSGSIHQHHQEQIGRLRGAQKVSEAEGCETCHGPGETHMELMDAGGLISFSGENPSPITVQNGMCLQCHQGGTLVEWHSSIHESEDIACTGCHLISKPDPVLERTNEAEVCYRCHLSTRSETFRMSTHPIREGKIICSDCHNAHGSNGPSMLKQLSLNDNCFSCHAEKRGPFLWEHYPVTEDCSLCHRVHGSNHPALLTRQGPQLCQQCHANIGKEGARHVRRFFDFDDPDPFRGRFVVGQNCSNCHTQVHGSNHPSGINLLR